MKTVSFNEFRKNASGLFSEVERGQVLVVMRHGKPIAEISPLSSEAGQTPSWQRPGLRLSAKGAGLAAAILEERARRMFLDSSALAKRYVEETGSAAVDDLCVQATELAVSVICVPEIISALNRRLRERRLTHEEYVAAKQFLSADVRDIVVINLVPAVISSSTLLLESNPIRPMDALHVASALEWGADLFASSDRRQLVAAKKAGLRTKLV